MLSFVSPKCCVATPHVNSIRPSLKQIVIAMAIALPASSFAQTAANANVQTVIVTATRTPQAARDVLSDNIVISAEEIQQSGQVNLIDLLQQKRGIEITTSGGPGSTSSVFIRGTKSAQNVVLVDGVRIGSSETGSATWENIPLSQIDHIEIVYGPLSSLYGADAMGGVVQIFTKQGDGAPHASASVGFGSYDTRTVDASISGSTTGDNKFRYALSVGRDESDGFAATTPVAYAYNPSKVGFDKSSVNGQLSWDTAKGHTFGLRFLQSTNDAQYDADHTATAPEVEKSNTYALYSRDQVMPNWTSLVQLSKSTDKLWLSFGPNWVADYDNAPSSTSRTTQTDFSWQNDVILGTDILQLIAERHEEKLVTDFGVDGERDINSIAASYQWKSGNQNALLSLRDDKIDQSASVAPGSQSISKITGNLAYGYHVSSALRVNVSYGTSFREPTFDDLYYPGYVNTSIQPEHGKNAETGLYYDDGKSQLSAVYYHNHITNLIAFGSSCPIAADLYGCAYNVGEALITGLTLGGATNFGDFALHGSLDLQNPRDETQDTVLARRSRKHGNVGVDYHQGNVQVGVDTILSGKRYDDEANTQVMGGYSLLNMHANYEISKDLTVFGRWNNVMNKKYELANGYTTAGSNLFVGLRYGFK
jgi:vitamin B12 transporter